MTKHLAFLAICLCLGCGGGGSPKVVGPDPAAKLTPVISNMQLLPSTAEQNDGGCTESISIYVDFTDVDADVTEGRLTYGNVTYTGGVAGATNLASGTLTGSIGASTATIGSMTVTISIIDSQGHESNALSQPFTVTAKTIPAPTLLSLSFG
jgi:hypothetical protein